MPQVTLAALALAALLATGCRALPDESADAEPTSDATLDGAAPIDAANPIDDAEYVTDADLRPTLCADCGDCDCDGESVPGPGWCGPDDELPPDLCDCAPVCAFHARPIVPSALPPLPYATVRADCHDLDDLIIGIGEQDIGCDDDVNPPNLLWIRLADAAAALAPLTVPVGAELPSTASFNGRGRYEQAFAGSVQIDAYDPDGGATGAVSLEFADGTRLETDFDARRCRPEGLGCPE